MVRSTLVRLAVAALLVAAGRPVVAQERQLVELPPPMQQHMMANMRDHLRALQDILAAVAGGDAEAAARIAEQRIGMTSLVLHDAAHLGRFMPEPMQRMGTELHRAASRFAVAVQDADLDPVDGPKAVFRALADVTATCNACHAAYRIR
ncbi:hypothetical protein [Azospirillum sp. ST 5-10]|uniref:hypothetical protein n=1 Tax=unclassified Azospirillum TaxID=2630922 RepID=UPI003F4A21E5